MNKKIILLAVALLAARIFSTGSIYYKNFQIQELTDKNYNPDLYLHTYNTLSNRLLLSQTYLESISNRVLDSKVDLYIFNPETIISYNSHAGHSFNDGSQWQGRGFNNRITAGLYLDSKYFTLTLMPEFWVAENRDFDTIETGSSSGFGDYWTVYDNLQRYGEDPYSEFTLGQSDIRFLFGEYFTVGASNQNITVGPGVYNSILIGNQGAGFPHADFGTVKPFPVFDIIYYEFRTTYGFLQESDFFDHDSSNDYGWFSGISIGITPAIARNFKIGINHYYTSPLESFEAMDLVRHIPGADTYNSATDLKDTVASVTFDYNSTEADFRVYGEIARNDQFSNLIGLWNEPEHSLGFTLGFKKGLLSFNNGSELHLSGEFTGLQQQMTKEHRTAGPWYRHAWAGWKQGYSNRGQLLGSSIGPGGNSQVGELTYTYNKGYIKFIFQRVVHDKDYYYHLVNNYTTDPYTIKLDPEAEKYEAQEAKIKSWTEAIYGLESTYRINDFNIYGRFEVNPQFNFNQVRVDDFINIYGAVGVSYSF